MPQFNPGVFATQLFWLALTFVPLYLILARNVLPKLGGILEARQRRMDDDLEKAAALRDEAEAVLTEYEKTRAEAEARAQTAMRQAQEEIAAETAKAHAQLGEKLGTQMEAAEARIEKAIAEAATGIRDVAAEVAATATERLIGVKPDAKASTAAVESSMKG